MQPTGHLALQGFSFLITRLKAFDLITHHSPLAKLDALQVPRILRRWIAAFLTDRKQQVRIGTESFSKWVTIKGGVPQGTKLGPILFLLMINDLQTNCLSYKYVDDTTIVHTSSDSNAQDLQIACDTAFQWSSDNDMVINPTKTKEILIDFSKRRKPPHPLQIDNTIITRVSKVKLLGVSITHDLKWNTHVDEITAKANQRVFWLSRLKRAGVPPDDLIMIYKSVVRPVLEYASAVWHPGLTNYLSQELESVQRRALRIVYPDCPYNVALETASLQTLSKRRAESCMKFFNNMQSEQHKLHHLLTDGRPPMYNLRNQSMYVKPKLKTARTKGSLINWCIYNTNTTLI